MEENRSYKKYIGAVLGILALGAVFLIVHAALHHSVAIPQAPASSASATAADTQSASTASATQTLAPASVIILESVPLPVGTDRFVVALSETNDAISADLMTGGYVTDAAGFTALLNAKGTVVPGGYKISKTMTPSELVQVLHGKPYMVWVVVPPGLRKEEIAALLGTALGWSQKTQSAWITTDTAKDPAYAEGVYFPDTYLIPVDDTPSDVATRLIDQFNESFAPALAEFNQQNIKWTTGLTLASIVQREAANDADMPLIAGILWNRLNQGMPLDVDATLQYARGNTGAGWWAPITAVDKQIDSPYNTYKNKGLPPHPISNPGLAAINAVLNPTETDCVYYIHDSNRVTHCAVTYQEQEANIQEYLEPQNQSTAAATTTP